MLKFCANLTFLFTEHATMMERIEAAHKIGFRGIEMAFPNDCEIDAILYAIPKLNLKFVMVNIAVDDVHPFGCAAIPDCEQKFLQNLFKSINFAKRVGCDKIHLMAGLRDFKLSYKDQITVYEKNLQNAANILEAEKMIGLIEPINKYSVPGYFLQDYDSALKIIGQIKKRSLRLQLDVYHLQRICGNLTSNIKRFLPYTAHIQVAQAPDRKEPCSPGEIDYGYVFDLITKSGYNYWIGLEFKPKIHTNCSLKWINFKKMIDTVENEQKQFY